MQLSKSQTLRLYFIATLLGLFCGRELWLWSFISIIGLSLFALALSYKKSLLLVPALGFLALSYAQYRHATDLEHDQLPSFYNQVLTLHGTVVSFPDIRANNQRVMVDIQSVKPKFQGVIIGQNLGRLLLVFPPETTLDYGDRVELKGILSRPRNFDGFDYQEYLKRFGIQSIMRIPEINIQDKLPGGSTLIYKAKQSRNQLEQKLSDRLPSPQDQIAMGILLGVKRTLPEPHAQQFKESGLQHLLVVSGFNVTVLITMIAIAVRRLGKPSIFVISSISLLWYVLMVGPEPPVLRAALFGGITGWAIVSGRFTDSRNLLLLSAVILGLYSPIMIQTDIGFFLSFAATLGIILFTPIIEDKWTWIPERFGLRTLTGVIVAAQLSVFPIIALYFETFPLAGFIANFFAEPLVPLAMGSSIVVLLSPDFLIPITTYPAEMSLSGLIKIAEIFSQWGTLEIPQNITKISLWIFICLSLWLLVQKPNNQN